MEKGGARGCVLARHVPTRGRWVLTKPGYTDRHQPANGHHQPLNGHQRVPGGVQSPRELQSDPLPWWGGWGEHAELISAVSLSRCAVSLLRARLAGSHLAPPRQSSPFVWSESRGQAARGARGPPRSPPRPATPGDTRDGCWGVLPATAVPN